MGVTHPSREECGRGLMLMFHSNSKMSTLIFVLFVSVKNVETLTTTIQAARFFFPRTSFSSTQLYSIAVIVLPAVAASIFIAWPRALPTGPGAEASAPAHCVYYSWLAPVDWAVIQHPNPGWGSIWAPFTVLTAGHWSQVRYTGAE